MTKTQYVTKFEQLFSEINTLMDDVKDLSSEAKEEGHDAGLLAKIGKARAQAKLGDLKAKTETLLTTIQEVS